MEPEITITNYSQISDISGHCIPWSKTVFDDTVTSSIHHRDVPWSVVVT